MEIESKQPHTSSLRGRQILERRKEIEQEIVEMLKETESDFTLPSQCPARKREG